MNVVLNTSEDLELTDFAQPDIRLVQKNPEAEYSAMQMFATSLGLCTYSVLYGYAENIDADPDDMSIRIRWDYVDNPFRIGHIDMDIRWPGLPESRLKAAQRAASHCTLHHTLEHPPKVVTNLES